MFILVGIGLLMGLAIGAVILSTACKLVRVKPPDFFTSMVICFVVTVAGFALEIAVGMLLAVISGGSALELQKLLPLGAPLAVAATPFLSAGVYSVMLQECTFGRGLLVWLAQLVVVVLFCLLIAAIAFGVKMAGGH